MYVLGHSGITLWAARQADPEIDWRAPVVLALLPDLIDKPIALLFPAWVDGSTRAFGHTLAAWLVALAAMALLRRRLRRPWLLWACFAGHAVLDMMWLGDSRAIFVWPLLGPFPAPSFGAFWSPVRIYNLVGELVGLTLLIRLNKKRTARS